MNPSDYFNPLVDKILIPVEKVVHTCSICNVEFTGYGHNPQPIIDDINARCCDDCNMSVIIARLVEYKERRDKNVL